MYCFLVWAHDHDPQQVEEPAWECMALVVEYYYEHLDMYMQKLGDVGRDSGGLHPRYFTSILLLRLNLH